MQQQNKKANGTMKTKIYILGWVSYTNEDNYLYNDQQVFTDKEKAMAEFKDDCDRAYEECKWGSQFDTPEEEREENLAYDVDESRGETTYNVSSVAYYGYKVEVSLKEVEIEIPEQ